MEDRNTKWRVGVIAVATFVVTALLIAATTSVELPFGVGQYQIQIQVDRAPGVGRNTPVRRDGVLIGRVDGTVSSPGGRLITVHISQSEPVFTSDLCQIRPSSLFGDAIIEFTQTDKAGEPVQSGATVTGRALRDPIDVIANLELGDSIASLGEAGDSVAKLANRVNGILGDDQAAGRVTELLDKAITAMDEFNSTMQQVSEVATDIDTIIGDQQTQDDLKRAFANAPKVIDEVLIAARQLGETIEGLDGAIASAERNLRNIEGLTEPIARDGDRIVQTVLTAVENLETALDSVSRFAGALSDSEGTLGKLVNDPMLYNNVNQTVCNANLVITRIYRLVDQVSPDVRAALHDLRIALDKVAREPGRVVTGALGGGSDVK